MRQFTYIEPITTTFYMAGQTIMFINGVCRLVDPSPTQLDWLDMMIKSSLIIETTSKKKTKPSKRAAQKKDG